MTLLNSVRVLAFLTVLAGTSFASAKADLPSNIEMAMQQDTHSVDGLGIDIWTDRPTCTMPQVEDIRIAARIPYVGALITRVGIKKIKIVVQTKAYPEKPSIKISKDRSLLIVRSYPYVVPSEPFRNQDKGCNRLETQDVVAFAMKINELLDVEDKKEVQGKSQGYSSAPVKSANSAVVQ